VEVPAVVGVTAGGAVGAAAWTTAVGDGVGGGPAVGAITTAVEVGGAGVASLIGVMTAAAFCVGGGSLPVFPIRADAQYQSNPMRRRSPMTGRAIRR
jgi:hypothetical protein